MDFEGLDQRVGTESREYGQASDLCAMTEDGCANNEPKANKDLLEAIIERDNLELAAKQVVANCVKTHVTVIFLSAKVRFDDGFIGISDRGRLQIGPMGTILWD